MAMKAGKTEAARFPVAELCQSKTFRHEADLLRAVLGDGAYTVEEARRKVETYKKGKVN